MADIVLEKIYINMKDPVHAYVSLGYFIDGDEVEFKGTNVYLDKMDRLELDMLAKNLLKRIAECGGDQRANLVVKLMDSN